MQEEEYTEQYFKDLLSGPTYKTDFLRVLVVEEDEAKSSALLDYVYNKRVEAK